MFKGHFATPEEIALLESGTDMFETGDWYERGRLVKPPKLLALGRSSYYIDFIEDLEASTGRRFYQSDFMTWPDPVDFRRSLAFYIDTSDEIHFSLRGIPARDVSVALRTEEPIRFMTLWEIRYIRRKSLGSKTAWYTNSSDCERVLRSSGMSSTLPYESTKPEWSEERILGYRGVD